MMPRILIGVVSALLLGCTRSTAVPAGDSETAAPSQDIATEQPTSRIDQSSGHTSDGSKVEFFQEYGYGNRDTFAVSISTAKRDYLKNEPVVVKVSVKNTTALVVSCGIREMERGLKVGVRDPHGRRLTSWQQLAHDEGIGPLFPLNPNEVVEAHWLLDRLVDADSQDHYKWDVFFDVPGVYELTVTYRNSSSNALTVQVREPTGADRRASELFRAIARFPLFAGDDESLLRCRQLIEDYPTTVYGQYARLTLGRYFLREAARADEEQSAQLLDEGVQILEDLLKQSPNFPLTLDAQYAVASAHYVKGRHALRGLSSNVEWLGATQAFRVGYGLSEP